MDSHPPSPIRTVPATRKPELAPCTWTIHTPYSILRTGLKSQSSVLPAAFFVLLLISLWSRSVSAHCRVAAVHVRLSYGPFIVEWHHKGNAGDAVFEVMSCTICSKYTSARRSMYDEYSHHIDRHIMSHLSHRHLVASSGLESVSVQRSDSTNSTSRQVTTIIVFITAIAMIRICVFSSVARSS